MRRGVIPAWAVALILAAWPRVSSAQSTLTLVAPAPGARVTAGAVAFEWEAVSGATSYQLTICRSSGCGGSGQIASITTAATTHQRTLGGGSYLYSVKAYQDTTLLAQSESRLFWADDFCGGPFLTGDFDGDGRTDRLCSAAGVTRVSLSTAEGFDEPQVWLSEAFVHPMAGDFNGDGLTDVADFINDVGGDFFVSLSTGQALGPRSHWGEAVATDGGQPHACRYVYAVPGTGDFNGDGKTDVTCKAENKPVGSDERLYVGLSTGTSFSFHIPGHALCDSSEDGGTLDFDGDGRSDWYCIGRGNDLALVYPYVNGGLRSPVTVSDSCEHQRYVLGDFNGDGRTDFACPPAGHVWLSTGSAYLYQGASSPSCINGQAFAADVDSDGAAELVCNSGGLQVRDWNGTAFGPEEQWPGYSCSTGLSLGDFNGDGQVDVLCDKQRAAVGGIPGARADLMASASNGFGGRADVSYKPSSDYPSSDPGASGVRQVVDALTVHDGRGGVSTRGYSYAGGKTDRQERQFLGFSYVRETFPCASAPCPYAETALSQELASVGRPTAVYQFDGSGQLLTAQTSTYQTNGSTVPRAAWLVRTDAYAWGTSDSRHTYASYAYDAYGNVSQTLRGGDAEETGDELTTNVVAFSYNPSAYILALPAQVETRGPGGELLDQVSYGYDASPPVRGDVLTVSRLLRYPGSSDEVATRTTTYWPNGNPHTVTDETGRTVSTTYESSTGYGLFPQTVTNGAGEAVGSTWDVACASVLTTTDPNGQTTTATYDSFCRPLRTDHSAGSYVQQSYLDLGDPSLQRARTETPPPPGAGGVGWTETYFDGRGRTWKTVSRGPSAGQDIVVERRYDVRGLPEEVTEPRYAGDAERVTHYEYDALGRVTRMELPGAREVLTSYEATSQTATDPDGKQTTSRVDAYGRVVETERSLNGQPVITQTRYDALGRRVGMTDPAGIEWTWAYDSLGRLREEWDPDAGHLTYTYDKAGRPLTQTDAKGQTTTFAYEPLVGRLQTRTNPSGTVSYTYGQARAGSHNVGQLTQVTSPADTLEMDYDALGRVWKQRRTFEGVTYAVQKTFDAGGYLQSTTYPDGDVVGGLTYDGAGRLAAVPGIATALTYDALGRPLTRSNTNSTQTTWSYTDPRGFLTRIHTTGAQGTVQDVQYTEHTDAGLLQRVTSPIPGEGWSYTYDDLNHMIAATHLQTPAESQSYTYDAADRILTSSRYGPYTYPTASQPHPHSPSTVSGIPLTYDLNGNVSQAGPRSLVWNADNRPVQITLGSLTTSFTYDGFGERLKKTSTQGTSLYPFGDDLEITNGVVTKYISVEGQGVLAKRVGPGAGAVTYWIHVDRLGSIQAVTNATGTAVHRRTYRPFGETLAQGGSHAESRGWIDQRNDPETGLTYLHARYFDPQLGTFLSPDPIGVEGGLNEYAYAGGDPVNWADRSGLLAGDQVVIIGPKDRDASPGYETYLEVNPLTVGGSAGTGGSLLWFLIERLFFAGPGSGGAGGSGSTTGNPPPGPEDLFQPRLGRDWDRPQSDPPTVEPPPPPPPGGGGGGGGGGGRGPTVPYTQPPIFNWIGGAMSSFGDSISSIGLGAVGSVDCLATGDCEMAALAYDLGPLGQTSGAGGFYYYGTRGALVTSGVAVSFASYGLTSEWLAAQGYFNVSGTIAHRAAMPFLRSSGSRGFSQMQARQLMTTVPRMGNYAGRTRLINWLTTARYAQPGAGEVVLNWWTRTIIHANPFF